MTQALVRTGYAALLEKVKRVLALGRARAKQALEHEEVRTWWEAAQAINENLRRHGGRAAYGKRTVRKLARDLGITRRYLNDILQFQRIFPIGNLSSQLTLTHYRIMARVEDPFKRHRLYLKVRREKLSVPALVEEIRNRRLLSNAELDTGDGEKSAGLDFPARGVAGKPAPTVTTAPLPPLKPRRGNFYTYRVVRTESLHRGGGFYSIDLGFGNRLDLKKLPGIRFPKAGEILESIRTQKDLRGDRHRFRRVNPRLGRPKDRLYTYKAFVTLVRDDDTLWADMDLGFRFSHEQKLRFRGIDAPEIRKGKQASDYVKRVLARVPFVVISATGRDKFGRPLADIFYKVGETDPEKVLREGTYLNQELLDRGLARRV